MPINTKESVTDRLERFEKVWEELAPELSFGGMTLAQFRAATQPSRDERSTIVSLDAMRSAAAKRREEADEASWKAIELVVNGVRGNPDFGSDSSLYRALGFVPKSERRSGLTRKVKSTATTSSPLTRAA